MTKLPLPRSTSETPLEVGFVGLGVMGRPMATRITQAGFPLTVHSRSATAVAQLVAAGARAAASPADVAARTDVVIVMVPDAPDLEAVLDGAQGILAEAHDGLVVAAMGTHHPAAMPPLARHCAESGVTLLDAPSRVVRSARSRAACRSWSGATRQRSSEPVRSGIIARVRP